MNNENMKMKNQLLSINLNVLNNNGLIYLNHSSFGFFFTYLIFIISYKFYFRYEQSKVYQYLKQSDQAYNILVERKESLINTQKLAYKDYLKRRQDFCNEKQLQSSIISIAKYYLLRNEQLNKIEKMKEKLIEFENKQKQLMESKNDKMKAWESVYTQPIKRDLMDFCLQTNIDKALTLSFNQIQQDIWSQPMTPTTIVLTPQNEQVELVSEEYNYNKPTVT